jgi:hypothetical protein
LGVGVGVLGFGALAPTPNPQSPIPNPQSPFLFFKNSILKYNKIYINYLELK